MTIVFEKRFQYFFILYNYLLPLLENETPAEKQKFLISKRV